MWGVAEEIHQRIGLPACLVAMSVGIKDDKDEPLLDLEEEPWKSVHKKKIKPIHVD